MQQIYVLVLIGPTLPNAINDILNEKNQLNASIFNA